MKCENAEVTAGNGAEDFAITKDGIVIASSGLMYPIFQGFRMITKVGAFSRWSYRPTSAWGSIETITMSKTHPTLTYFYLFYSVNYPKWVILSLEERRIGKMVMLDTKNPAAKPVELTLTNLPSNFKFTPMGIG